MAELTAVLRVQTTGFMSALADADKALTTLQGTIAATEKASVGLGVNLASSLKTASGGITVITTDIGSALAGVTTAVEGMSTAMTTGFASLNTTLAQTQGVVDKSSVSTKSLGDAAGLAAGEVTALGEATGISSGLLGRYDAELVSTIENEVGVASTAKDATAALKEQGLALGSAAAKNLATISSLRAEIEANNASLASGILAPGSDAFLATTNANIVAQKALNKLIADQTSEEVTSAGSNNEAVIGQTAEVENLVRSWETAIAEVKAYAIEVKAANFAPGSSEYVAAQAISKQKMSTLAQVEKETGLQSGLVPIVQDEDKLRGTKIESPFTKSAAGEIDSVAKSTRGAAGSFFNLGTAAAFASTSFLVGLFGGTALRSVIDASRQLSTAQAVLGNAVKDVGGDWNTQQKAVEAYISKLASASGFIETDLTNGLTRLVAATGSVKAGQDALNVATDLARAKNLDLATGVRDVTLVTEGHAAVLRRQGIVLPVITAAMQAYKEKVAAASDAGIHFTAASKLQAAAFAKAHDTAATAAIDMVILRTSVQGADKAYIKSSQGGIDEFKVAMERVKVEIGGALLPSFDKLIGQLGKVASAWVKSGALAKGAKEGIDLFKQAVETVAPVVEDLFHAIKDAVDSLGGLKAVLIDLAALWVAKFAVLEHPVLTLVIVVDQLLQHFQALHGVIGPLAAVAGGVFLAMKLGAADVINKLIVFFGLAGAGTTEFKSLNSIIISGQAEAQGAFTRTIAVLRGLTAQTVLAADASKGLAESQVAAGMGAAGRTLGPAALGGEEAAGGLASVPFGPIALGVIAVGGALAYLLSRESPVTSATKDLTKSLLGFQNASQQLTSNKLAVEQDKLSLSQARSALAAVSASRGSMAYKEALLGVKQAVNQLSNDQQTLKTGILGTAEAFKKATDSADGLLKASIAQTAFEGGYFGPGSRQQRPDAAEMAAINAKKASDSLSIFTNAIQKNIVANNQFSPTIQHNGLLLNQFAKILGDPKLITPHEVKVILQNQDAKAQLMDLLGLLGKLPKEVTIQIREQYLVSTVGSPPSAFTGRQSGSLQSSYSGINQVDRNAIAAATTALTEHNTVANTNRLIAANQKALKDVQAVNANATTYAAKQQDIQALTTAIKDLKTPAPDLTVKDGSGGGKLTGLAAQIGTHAANALSRAQAAAASAGTVTAGTYDPKVLEAQKHLRTTLLETMAALHKKLSEVGGDTKEGVAINKEIASYSRSAATALKDIDKEKTYKEAAEVHRKVDALLGIGKAGALSGTSPARARAEEHTALLDILKKEGGKAGLSAFGTVAGDSNKQLEALLKDHGGEPRSTLNSLAKIDKSINIVAAKGQKLTADENANIQQRLKEIKDTLTQNRYASNYITPSAHTLTAGLGLTRTQRIEEETRYAQALGHNGQVPTNLAGAGVPFPGSGAYGPDDGGPGTIAPRRPHPRGAVQRAEIHIENVNINDKNIYSLKKLQAELLAVGNRNTTQTKGANAGRGLH